MNRIKFFSTETQAPFNSPSGGKSLRSFGEGGGRGFCGLKAQKTLAWGNALRNRITLKMNRLRVKPAMTGIVGTWHAASLQTMTNTVGANLRVRPILRVRPNTKDKHIGLSLQTIIIN